MWSYKCRKWFTHILIHVLIKTLVPTLVTRNIKSFVLILYFSISPNHQVLTAQVSDTGRYVCVADNVAGSAEKSFNLNVHGKSHVNQ